MPNWLHKETRSLVSVANKVSPNVAPHHKNKQLLNKNPNNSNFVYFFVKQGRDKKKDLLIEIFFLCVSFDVMMNVRFSIQAP